MAAKELQAHRRKEKEKEKKSAPPKLNHIFERKDEKAANLKISSTAYNVKLGVN